MAERSRQQSDVNEESVRGEQTDERIRGVANDDEDFDEADEVDEEEEDEDSF